MTLLAIPNVSEGRDETRIDQFGNCIRAAGARVLDIHSDTSHNRSVLTVTGSPAELVEAMTTLAREAKAIDLTVHEGVHPRLGALDVCPIVPHEDTMTHAVAVAHEVGRSLGTRASLPVYYYGEAATPPGSRELPAIRKRGLKGLAEDSVTGRGPDEGPRRIDPRHGVVCVGARSPLIAFNVFIDEDLDAARQIAAQIRSPGIVRALGMWVDHLSLAQVSMNLIAPHKTGIDDAFESVELAANRLGAIPVATETVGLVPEDHLPDPNGKAARLLIEPGRSLESVLAS